MKRNAALILLAVLFACASALSLWSVGQLREVSAELQNSTRTVRQQRETIELLRQQRTKTLTQIKALREQMQTREVQLKEKARTDLDAALDELGKLRRLVDTRNRQLDRIQDALKEMEEENEQLRQQLRSRNATIASLRQKRTDSLQTVEGLHGIVREKNQRIIELHREIQTQGVALRTRNATAVRLREDLRDAKRNAASMRRKLEKKKSRITELEEQNERLTRERDASKATVDGLEAELSTAEQRIADLEKELDRKSSRISELKETIAGLKATISGLQNEKQRVESRVQRMQSAYESLTNDLRKQIQNQEVLVERLREKVSITLLESVLFDLGQSSLTRSGKKTLRKVGRILNDLERKKLRIVGHTDPLPIGEELRWKYPSNWELSAHRAAAVVRFLQNQCNVDPEDMEAVGRSCYHPEASNRTTRGRAENRRVEIVIAPKYTKGEKG